MTENPIYTRLAIETGITDAQDAFCRLACGTDEVSRDLRAARSESYGQIPKGGSGLNQQEGKP